ncbi:hypothetical protein K525DRAFT_263159 [Schizophyllum commune Loenen D]|nr:hypothetical protein K525DRAFT_263159 [Schizophyllum commune Loenen D]
MHRVLEIPELQLAIAQELKTPRSDWRSRRRKDLYNLSLVSHSWRSVAEPMRWEEGNRLEDFLRVLPSDAWDRVITEVEDWYLDTIVLKKIRTRSICRHLSSDDWSAVYQRTRFARSLILRQHAGLRGTLVNLLSTIPPAGILFPKLLELVLDMDDEFRTEFTSVHSNFILAISTPNLAHLTIKNPCHTPRRIYLETLSELALRSQGLRSVVFDTKSLLIDSPTSPVHRRPSPYRGFFQTLRSCPSLTTVRLDIYVSSYDRHILANLAAYPSLRDLTLDMERSYDLDEFDLLEEIDKTEELLLRRGMSSMPTPSFPSLQMMRSTQLPHEVLRALIAAGNRAIPLSTLHFEADISSYEDLRATITAICSGCDKATLTELDVEFFCTDPQGDPRISVLDLDALSPLATFARLTRVELAGFDWVDLSDADYAEIARWWPDLVSLALVTDRSTPSCTLAALIPLSSSCPRLESLDLSVSAEEVPARTLSGDDLPTTTRRTPPRFTLRVQNSPITQDEDSVALFLLSLFPTIQEVTYDMPAEVLDPHNKESRDAEVVHERKEAWGRVNELIVNHRNAGV